MSLNSGEIMQRAIKGNSITMKEALEVYADPNNWETALEIDASRGCHWKWKGPVIVGYELAQIVLKMNEDE